MRVRLAVAVSASDEALALAVRLGESARSRGDEVAILTLRSMAPLWRGKIDAAGLGLVTVEQPEQLASVAQAFDFVWFPETGPLAAPTLRHRQESGRTTPCVAVTGGDAYCERHADVVGAADWETIRSAVPGPASEHAAEEEFDPILDGRDSEEPISSAGFGNGGWVAQELLNECARLEKRNDELERRLQNRVPRYWEPGGRLRILHLIPYLPYPPHSGGRMRSWFMAKYFDARHDLTVMAFSDAGTLRTLRQAAREIRGACFGVTHGRLAGGNGLPPLVRGHYRENMRAALKLIPFQQFDLALVDSLYMAAYREDLATNVVLCEQNIESELVPAGEERELVQAYENRVWREFPLRFVTSGVDLAIMNRRCPTGRAVVVPNGADPNQQIAGARPDLNTILMAGSLDYHPNIDGACWFMESVWPLIRKNNGSARLVIAGRNPPAQIRRFDGRDGVRVIANPSNMADVAAKSSLSIAPLRLGSGTRIKILDSFAWGIPVVSTPRGCEGLEVEDGAHLLIRSAPEEFAEACNRVLRDRELWTRLRANGRDVLLSRYSWNRIFEACEQELEEHLSAIGASYRLRSKRA